ncbi:hypothetical protein SOHN41_00695 [Shewanella sp. HN-41]|nr:hypothetical protein SOHN41_00695 [Shewanella sp. HN-41]
MLASFGAKALNNYALNNLDCLPENSDHSILAARIEPYFEA